MNEATEAEQTTGVAGRVEARVRRFDTAGYICMSRPKKSNTGEYMQPMAYGDKGDPWPDELLHFRGATLFPTEDAAKDALRRTLHISEERGDEWPKKFTYLIVTVRYA